VFERSIQRSCRFGKIIIPAATPVEGALKRAQKTLAEA
jgi:hypothetical protein